jgi:hypothetical protein
VAFCSPQKNCKKKAALLGGLVYPKSAVLLLIPYPTEIVSLLMTIIRTRLRRIRPIMM